MTHQHIFDPLPAGGKTSTVVRFTMSEAMAGVKLVERLMPVVSKLMRRLGLPEPGEIPSPFPVIEVKTHTAKEGSTEIVVSRISPAAKQFFGYAPNYPTHKLVGRSARELLAKLQPFVDPPRPSWTDLGHDQSRVFKEVEEYHEAYANVPVRFNGAHKQEEFRKKTFIPIITEIREGKSRGSNKATLRVLYLDVVKLPKTLFTKTIWNNVIKEKEFDLNLLADDFERIRAEFSKEIFIADDYQKNENERINRVQALESAIESLRKGEPETLEDLSRAGWFRLRTVAKKMRDAPPGEALRFIEQIIGREQPPPPGAGG